MRHFVLLLASFGIQVIIRIMLKHRINTEFQPKVSTEVLSMPTLVSYIHASS